MVSEMHEQLDVLKRKILRLDELEEGANINDRIAGNDWPKEAESMIGDARMENIRECLETVIKENIPGDFIECGVWRGGACIYAKAVIDAWQSRKKVIVADSFCGFPEPKFNWDKGADFLKAEELQVTEGIVKHNFEKYGYLDERVVFVKGFFEDTLPKLNEIFSVIRADGDLFESTIDILENLYPRLSVGGFIIIDDFNLECCQVAVYQYTVRHKIPLNFKRIDHMGVFWRKDK